jgi:capsular exopolysaccharide synthesis family protein
MGDDSQYVNTQIQILKFPKTAYGVMKALDLTNNPKFTGRVAAQGNQEPQIVPVTAGETDERLEMAKFDTEIKQLIGSVDVARQRDTRLVLIKYRHTDRELAKKITDTWADVYVKNHLASRRQGSQTAADELNERIQEVKIKLGASSEKLMNYRNQQGILDFGEKQQENPVLARLVDLHKQLLLVESQRKGLEAAFNRSQEAPDPSKLPEVQRDPGVQELNKNLADLKEKEAKLLVDVTKEHPDAVALAEQISAVEGMRRAAYERIKSGIGIELQTAKQREEMLRQDFNKQLGETRKQDEGAIRAKLYQQEVDTYQVLLDKLYQSQKEMQVSASAEVNNVRVANYSPLKPPVGPPRSRNIMLSLMLALLGGVGLVLFIDYLNNKIESVEDIDRYLRLPALGVIPIFPMGKARKRLAGVAASKELTPAKANGHATGGAMILTEVESTSSIAESYRQLRTAVLLSSAEHAPRTILFTSSQPAEGKTTTSVNMAISLAQTGSAVLIVDADLRRPRVHKIFGLKNTRGLCNYLAGDCDLSSLVQVALPNLYVLPVGPLPPNPAELLGSPKMRQVVEMLSKNFDYVLIDSPPVASFADSLILSSMVEGVIVVVKAGFTAREMAQRTKMHLQSVGAKILGVVINHIKLQPHDYYYYSTYYSRYYYQSGGDGEEAGVERESKAAAKNA